MFHKIKSAIPISDHVIYVIFSDGELRSFDIDNLLDKYPAFKQLKESPELFNSLKVDFGGYGIVWNDELDLSAEGIYEKGLPISGSDSNIEINKEIINYLVDYRKQTNVSQQDLSYLSGVAQPAIARIEKGKTDPQLSTFIKLLSSLGLKLEIVKTK